MIDFEWYRSFIAVYRVGTVSGAAQTRNLTQPAVTQHLAALESAVGSSLFTRAPRRMLPTERGKELYHHIVQALEKLEQVSTEFRSSSDPDLPLLRLGTPPEFFYEVALARLQTLPARLKVQFGMTSELIEELVKSNLDAVIASQHSTRYPELEYRKLAEERFIVVTAKDGELPENISPENLVGLEHWLAQQAWVSYGVELPIIRRFWQTVFAKRPEFQPVLIIPDLRAIMRAVSLGYGISVLPDYLCQVALEQTKLRVIWQPDKPVKNELWLAYRKVERHKNELKQLIKLLA